MKKQILIICSIICLSCQNKQEISTGCKNKKDMCEEFFDAFDNYIERYPAYKSLILIENVDLFQVASNKDTYYTLGPAIYNFFGSDEIKYPDDYFYYKNIIIFVYYRSPKHIHKKGKKMFFNSNANKDYVLPACTYAGDNTERYLRTAYLMEIYKNGTVHVISERAYDYLKEILKERTYKFSAPIINDSLLH